MAAAAAAIPFIKPVVEKTIKEVQHPVIGFKKTVTKRRKSGDTVTTYSAEVRAWELALLGFFGLATVATVVNFDQLEKLFTGATKDPLGDWADKLFGEGTGKRLKDLSDSVGGRGP